MRGAADSFGIVVNFYLRTQPAPESVVNWEFGFDRLLTDVPGAVAAFMQLQDFAQDPATVDRYLSFGLFLDGGLGLRVTGVYMGSLARFQTVIAPKLLGSLPKPPSFSSIKQVGWLESLTMLSGRDELAVPPHGIPDDRHNFFAKSVTSPDRLSEAAITSYFRFICSRGPTAPVAWFSILNLLGGADSQVDIGGPGFSACPSHSSFWIVQNYGSAPRDSPFPKDGVAFVNELNDSMTCMLSRYGAYLNYTDPSLGRDKAHVLYYGEDLYKRLEEVKERLDPDNVFANPQSIGRGLA